MKELPLGQQTFKDIIESNYLYIDKTKEIYKFLDGKRKKYFFLSRTKRFGKPKLQNKILDEHIDKIFDTYQYLKEEEKIDLNLLKNSLLQLEKKISEASKLHNTFLKELGLPELQNM